MAVAEGNLQTEPGLQASWHLCRRSPDDGALLHAIEARTRGARRVEGGKRGPAVSGSSVCACGPAEAGQGLPDIIEPGQSATGRGNRQLQRSPVQPAVLNLSSRRAGVNRARTTTAFSPLGTGIAWDSAGLLRGSLEGHSCIACSALALRSARGCLERCALLGRFLHFGLFPGCAARVGAIGPAFQCVRVLPGDGNRCRLLDRPRSARASGTHCWPRGGRRRCRRRERPGAHYLNTQKHLQRWRGCLCGLAA